jgi:ferric-chelate reductase
MVTDVRNTVAGCNEASKVWRGEDEADVDLVFDERLE